VAVKIKLKRMGKMRNAQYRIVVADARTKRDGRAIEEIGLYRPKEDPSFMQVDADRVAYWLGVGAQPTEAVTAILKVTGDWQKFRNEPAPPPMKVREPKLDKHARFEAAAKDAGDQPKDGATTPRTKKAPKAAEATETAAVETAAPEAPADAAAEAPAGTAAVEAPVAEPAEAPEAAAETAPEPAAEPAPEA